MAEVQAKSKAQAKVAKPPVRDRLLASAARLFAERSFEGVSVREICKASGTSINMVHHYFGNKDGLLDEVLQSFDNNVYAIPLRLLQSPASSKGDLEQRLVLIFETTLEACLEHRDHLVVAIRQQAALDTLSAFQEGLVAFLETAKQDGYVREALDCEMISGAILDRVVSQAQFAPWIKESTGIDLPSDGAYRSRWCRANVDLFLHGIISNEIR